MVYSKGSYEQRQGCLCMKLQLHVDKLLVSLVVWVSNAGVWADFVSVGSCRVILRWTSLSIKLNGLWYCSMRHTSPQLSNTSCCVLWWRPPTDLAGKDDNYLYWYVPCTNLADNAWEIKLIVPTHRRISEFPCEIKLIRRQWDFPGLILWCIFLQQCTELQ